MEAYLLISCRIMARVIRFLHRYHDVKSFENIVLLLIFLPQIKRGENRLPIHAFHIVNRYQKFKVLQRLLLFSHPSLAS